VDLASLLGLALGLSVLLLGRLFEGGGIDALLQPTAALIVFGGTFGATLLSTPPADIARGLRMLRQVFLPAPSQAWAVQQSWVQMALIARKEGIIALEGRTRREAYPFSRFALQHVVDGTNAQLLREILETDLAVRVERDLAAARVFETAGGFAPTVGILGAVLGLIQTMENLADPAALGAGIAVAFVATVYGVGCANLVFIPIANKLRTLVERERNLHEMIIEAALAVHSGQSPSAVDDRLRAFLSPELRGEARAA
jgi:chemotaxis protein MotA